MIINPSQLTDMSWRYDPVLSALPAMWSGTFGSLNT